MTKPKRTVIDWVLSAETLVLARPDPDKEFSYKVSEVLRGQTGPTRIPFLVNARARQSMARRIEDAVLFRWTEESGWSQVAYVDSEYRAVLDTALAHREVWAGQYPASRLAVFEALLDSSDARLRELAIRELDKAPYGLLRSIELKIPVEELLSDLWTRAGYPYQPIRVLLLGLSNDDRARAEMYDYFERVHGWDWANNIGAFAAALVELEGAVGVRFLEHDFLLDPTQPPEKVRGVITALALQRGHAAPDTVAAIDAALARTLDMRSELAGTIAREFTQVADWSQAQALEALLQGEAHIPTADLVTVSVYISQARRAAPRISADQQEG
ncbi:hypothetical protein [Tropicimonas sp. S265A]|uniref:hypothetical protein n=1 Tax=Tropicimonas sp. S265A TaxID=3415134 RepID=UPI003C7B4FA2